MTLEPHASPGLRRRYFAALVALACSFLGSRAAETPPRPPPEFRQVPPLASLRAAADAAKIPLDPIGAPLDRTTLVQGDVVTALVSLTDGAQLQQWLVALEVVEATAKEKQDKNPPMVFHRSSGHVLRFDSERAALAIRTFGPLAGDKAGGKPPAVKQSRAVVDADFLMLGLHRAPAMSERMRKARDAVPGRPHGEVQIGPQPYPPEVVAQARKNREIDGVTEADERGLIGSFLAVVQFFQIASRTPGLQDVVMSVIDIPWWSIIRRGGKMPGVNFDILPDQRAIDETPWGLPKGSGMWAFPFGLRLNGEPALLCQLAVVEPRPPLLPAAGIVGLAAGRPDGKGPC